MLSVVLPAYNEAELLGSSVRDLAAGLRERSGDFEILVVENGSIDATSQVAHQLAEELPEVRVVSLLEADYGAALRAGLLAIEGERVATFDVDYYDFEFLDRALAVLDDGGEIVVASKRARGADDRRAWPRRVVTRAFARLIRIFFRSRITDTHGMKVYRRDTIAPIARDCRSTKDLFDTELLLRAERRGAHIVEIPVAVGERRPSRTPIWRRVPRTLLGLVRLRMLLRGRRGAGSGPHGEEPAPGGR